MILTAYEPAYLPWPGVFSRIRQADLFVFCDTDRLSRKDFLTRNRIKTKDGVKWLTVPVLGGRNQKICQVQTDGSKDWWHAHRETLRHAYSRAPFFTELPEPTSDWFADFASDLMVWMIESLDLGVPVESASSFHIDGAGSEFILNLCRTFEADTYLCGPQARNYLDFDAFRRAGVEVDVQEYTTPEYPQLHGGFVPDLSIVDLVFNTGMEAVNYL